MKAIPSALATHLQGSATTVGYLLRVTRKLPDGQIFGFTSADEDVTISGVQYRSTPGLDVSSIAGDAGGAVDNLELSTLDDGSVFTQLDVIGGLWRNADFLLGRYNWRSPADGIDVIMVGVLGELRYVRDTITVELRGLQQFLQQPVGSVSSKNCRARLGDTLCTKALGPLTFAAAVTSVTSNQIFAATALTQAADFFGDGILTWTSGPNIHLREKVKTHAAGGVLTLSLPMFQAVAIGHTFSVVAGCRKRMAEDCITKFNNVLNFQGEPHLPGIDAVSKPPK
jgi:uncharacterized phage protein (TIGR02218 family)